MSERVEKDKVWKGKLQKIRHLTLLSSVTEMITNVRNKNEQKTNGIYINNTEFNCDENISSHSDVNDTSEKCHNNSDSELKGNSTTKKWIKGYILFEILSN